MTDALFDVDKIESSIKTLSAKKRVTVNKALLESGAGKNFISNMKDGKTPGVDKIIALSNYFYVPVDEILGRKLAPKNQDEEQFAKHFKSAPLPVQEAILKALRPDSDSTEN